ncbi:hypothetical protein G6549_20120 [Bacillus sp. MM2020_1]|nr:hypothetical protein [Bacillus sp. MM2020_1]
MNIKKSILIFLVVLALGAQSPTYTKAMNEEMRWFHLLVIKEYKEKFNKEILVPMHFPFKMTHVQGKVSGKKIFLQYQNKEISGVLGIHVEPTAGEITLPKGNMYKPVSLNKGYHGFIGKTQKGFELIFLSDNMQYSVKLLGDNKKYKPSKKELIKVVNWMLFTKVPRGMYWEDN